MTKIVPPRRTAPNPLGSTPGGAYGANPVFEREARARTPGPESSVVRRAPESLPRAHRARVGGPEQEPGLLGRVAVHFAHWDRALGAALLGLGALQGSAGGAPLTVLTDPGALDRELAALLERPSFAALPPATQAAARVELARHADDRPARTILGGLLDGPGFAALSEEAQVRLLRYVGGRNEQVSTPARWALGRLIGQDEFRALDRSAQATRLLDFLAEQPGARELVVRMEEASSRAPYALGAPVEVPGHRFHAGAADALRYDLSIDGRRVSLWAPKSPDPSRGHFHTVEEAAKALAGLPRACRDVVDAVVIEPARNPDDAYWAGVFRDPAMRAYMTAADGRVSVYPTEGPMGQTQLDGTIIHETGHLLATRAYGSAHEDQNTLRWGPWRRAMATDGFWPSRYGHRAAGEDFAESVQLYVLARGTPDEAELRQLFPARFAVLDALLRLPVSPPPRPMP